MKMSKWPALELRTPPQVGFAGLPSELFLCQPDIMCSQQQSHLQLLKTELAA